jgi:thiol-disulfide isomerase/thioredoxin
LRLRHAVLVAAVAAAACSGARSEAGRPTADWRHVAVTGAGGRQLPATTIPDLLRGRPALVNLWAPWCESCVRELPLLEQVARRAAACGAAVVGVAVGETPATVAAFPPVKDASYPLYVDQDFALADSLGQRRIPATLVIDGSGRIVYAGSALDGAALAALRGTLAGPSAPGCALPPP